MERWMGDSKGFWRKDERLCDPLPGTQQSSWKASGAPGALGLRLVTTFYFRW